MDDDALAKLVEAAKLSVGHEHGLTDVQSRRLVGLTVNELHTDAKAMCRELGVPDPSEQSRDQGGRFQPRSMNEAIRAAAGR